MEKYDGLAAEPGLSPLRRLTLLPSLGLMVMEKQGEVAILQTQGLTPRQIMMVFMVQGPALGLSVRSSERRLAHCLPAS